MGQTSIEWLIKEILKYDKSFVEFYGSEIEQAKENHQKKKMGRARKLHQRVKC